MSFSICMSLNLLCVISIERYIYVVYNGFYTRIVIKKLLAIAIISFILISFMWATTDAHLRAKLDIVKLAKTYIALSAYAETVLAIGIVFNVTKECKTDIIYSWISEYLSIYKISNRNAICFLRYNHSKNSAK